jgi:hypothetical protein
MSQSRPRCIGLDVHTDAIAVAYVAQDHGAEVNLSRDHRDETSRYRPTHPHEAIEGHM